MTEDERDVLSEELPATFLEPNGFQRFRFRNFSFLEMAGKVFGCSVRLWASFDFVRSREAAPAFIFTAPRVLWLACTSSNICKY